MTSITNATPGQLDADGWLVPKRPKALAVYRLAKTGMRAREIAALTGCTIGSVRVMRWWMRHPRMTEHGPVMTSKSPKTQQKRTITGKYVEKGRRQRARLVPITERERRAYGESRYDAQL